MKIVAWIIGQSISAYLWGPLTWETLAVSAVFLTVVLCLVRAASYVGETSR